MSLSSKKLKFIDFLTAELPSVNFNLKTLLPPKPSHVTQTTDNESAKIASYSQQREELVVNRGEERVAKNQLSHSILLPSNA